MSYNPFFPTKMKHTIIDSALTQDAQLMQLLRTYYPVKIKDIQDYAEKLTWCLEHCQNKFRDINTSEGRVWYFQNDQDALMFALKWGR